MWEEDTSEVSKAGPLSMPVPTQPTSPTWALRMGRLGAGGPLLLAGRFALWQLI